MRKFKRLIFCLAIALVLSLSLGVVSACLEPDNTTTAWTLETAYAEATSLGYEGTLEEFLETIKGKDG